MDPLLHPLLQSVGLPVPEGLTNGVVQAVSCDSRRVGPGTLFVGLPGSTVDGGSFWPAALDAGAVAAVISPAAAAAVPPAPGRAVLVHPEPLAPLAGALAAAFWGHPSQKLALIGVTGTNGKTTITHLIEHLAAFCGRPSALFGTLVNRWPGLCQTAHHTTPFADELQTLLAEAVQAGASVAAIEVSSHALDQARVAGCEFAGAVFSNLTQDHLDYHPSMEAYFEAKARLFAPPLLLEAEGPRAVVNGDDPWGRQLAERLGRHCWRSSLGASEAGDAELRLADLSFSASGVCGRLITPLGEGRFASPLLGRFNLMNMLQAVGALQQQGLPLELLLEGVSRFGGVPGRMERVSIGHGSPLAVPTVLVDYAHTPDGLENALKASRPFASGRLICVFGCGGDRDRGKRPLMGAIAAALADRVVVTSDNPRTEDPQRILDDVVAGIPPGSDLLVEGDRASAIAATVSAARPEDLVLIAGKGHEDYQILGTKRIHFDDREEAEKALRGRSAAAPA